MFYWFLAIATVLGFLGLIHSANKVINAREKAEFYEIQKAAATAALKEKEEIDKAKILADITLSFDNSKLFDSKTAPSLSKDQATYTEIVNDYIDWYEKNGYGHQLWFNNALKRLNSQNGYIDFVYQDIQHVLEMLDSKGLHEAAKPCVERVQSVLDTYAANREESLRLIVRIHTNQDDDMIIRRLKEVILCLIGDDDELIKGLDSFNASMHKFLAEVCQDKTTDHVTDFTSLNELLQIPEQLEKAMAESKRRIAKARAKEAQKANVPTLDVPEDTNRTTLSYFQNLGLDKQPATAQQFNSSTMSANESVK